MMQDTLSNFSHWHAGSDVKRPFRVQQRSHHPKSIEICTPKSITKLLDCLSSPKSRVSYQQPSESAVSRSPFEFFRVQAERSHPLGDHQPMWSDASSHPAGIHQRPQRRKCHRSSRMPKASSSLEILGSKLPMVNPLLQPDCCSSFWRVGECPLPFFV